MHLEDLINILNEKWTFKILVFLILSFPSFQYYGQLQIILLALVKPKFKCIQNVTKGIEIIDSNQCTIRNILINSTSTCTKFKFSDTLIGRTIVADYQLVCNRQVYGDLMLVIWFLAVMFNPIEGWLADKYGRKILVIFNLSLEIVASILITISPNIYFNMAFRALLGISTSGLFVSFTWLSEIVDNNNRILVGSFYWLFGCLAYILFPLLAYVTQDWRATQGYCIIPSILYLFILFVPESPRWLYIVGDIKGAIQSLKIIRNINKLDKTVKMESFLTYDSDITSINVEDKSLKRIIKSFIFIKYFIVLFLLQASIFMLYSAVSINLTILHHNLLISMCLIGSMELPGLFLSFFSLKYMSRRISIVLWSFLGSILFFGSIFLNRNLGWQSIARIIIGCIAKIPLSAVNIMLTVYVTELFPTSHRTLGVILMQFANFTGFVGAIYINHLQTTYFFLPILIYSIQVWISCILLMFTLPNTRNLPIPESLEDQRMLRLGHENEYLEYMNNKRSFVIYKSDTKSNDSFYE